MTEYWRDLEIGETKKAGDRFLDNGEWVLMQNVHLEIESLRTYCLASKLTQRKAPDELKQKSAEMVSAVRSINRSRHQELKIPNDDDPVYWQRKEWVEWILDLANELDRAIQDT